MKVVGNVLKDSFDTNYSFRGSSYIESLKKNWAYEGTRKNPKLKYKENLKF